MEDLFNTGLIPIQWHLIYRGIQPSIFCNFWEDKGILRHFERIDDSEFIEPPPWKPLILRVPERYKIDEVQVLDQKYEEIDSIVGNERVVLQHLDELIMEEDPDIIVTDDPRATLRHIISRARSNNVNLCFGRGGEKYHGRIIIGHRLTKIFTDF